MESYMRKSSFFLSLLVLMSSAHADSDDDLFTVINKTSQNLRIRAVGEGKDDQDKSTPPWEIQSEIDGGQKKIFKRKELGEAFQSEKIKLMEFSNLTIALNGPQKENERVLKLSHSHHPSFVITDAFLRHLGLIK